MEKSSLIYVRNVSANSASAQAREISMIQHRNWDWVWPRVRDCVHAWNQRPARQCELRSWR